MRPKLDQTEPVLRDVTENSLGDVHLVPVSGWCSELGPILRFELPNHSRSEFFVGLNRQIRAQESCQYGPI
jgi:hypothetical protein